MCPWARHLISAMTFQQPAEKEKRLRSTVVGSLHQWMCAAVHSAQQNYSWQTKVSQTFPSDILLSKAFSSVQIAAVWFKYPRPRCLSLVSLSARSDSLATLNANKPSSKFSYTNSSSQHPTENKHKARTHTHARPRTSTRAQGLKQAPIWCSRVYWHTLTEQE